MVLFGVLFFTSGYAQEKKAAAKTDTKSNLADIRTHIRTTQNNAALYTKNLKDHSEEIDVLTIINVAEKYLDSTARSKEQADALLRKHFMGLRNFFLTVNNKTSVSASFLYTDAPYHFCTYNDTATALYIAALKDGDTYSAREMTEKKIASAVFQDCVLPSLRSLNEFKDNDLKYFGISIYYGCKDNRETAPGAPPIRAYCLSFVARFADIRNYTDGRITAEDLTDRAEIYIANEELPNDFRRIKVVID